MTTKRTNRLTALSIREVSLVDDPACPGADILLTKSRSDDAGDSASPAQEMAAIAKQAGDWLHALADELRSTNPALTEAQAFVRAARTPVGSELYSVEREASAVAKRMAAHEGRPVPVVVADRAAEAIVNKARELKATKPALTDAKAFLQTALANSELYKIARRY